MENSNPMTNAAVRRPCIIHSLPGRLRIHLPFWPAEEPGLIEAILLQTPGVHAVRANPLTSNVLIHFDSRTTCPAALTEVLDAVNRDAIAAHPKSSEEADSAGDEKHQRPTLFAVYPVQRNGDVGSWRATPSIRRTTWKVRPMLRRARQAHRISGTLKTALDVGRISRRFLTDGEVLSLREGLLTPGSVLAVGRYVPWLGLDHLLGRDLAEFFVRATGVLLKLFGGGLAGVLLGCFEGLLLLADVLS